jgi:signal transduction histidine kinase/CheY-like chemotaxis protein
MGEGELRRRVKVLERESRILTARLDRSEANRRRLEDLKERHETLQRTVIADLREARLDVQRANTELERRVDERTEALIDANEALIETRDAALAANRAKSYFLATMSHELRTPLNAIIGYSELLDETVADGQASARVISLRRGASVIDGESASADIKRVVGAARHLLSIIDDVLDLSKIEAGTTRLNYERVDLPEFLQEISDTARTLARRQDNRFRLTADALPSYFVSDRTKLRQIVLNLLSNAAKFTHRGTIEVRVFMRDAGLEIAVVDTGIGIARGDFEKLFKPFSQVDAATNRRFEGTGLGLALTRSHCRMLGGDVRVESEFGAGSTFTISLPLSPPKVSALNERVGGAPLAPLGLGAEVSLVVVDDDEHGRDAIVRALRAHAADVLALSEPRAAVARVAEAGSCVVILDVLRSDRAGWALLDQFVALGASVLVMSALNDAASVRARGAAGFVRKPAELEALLNALRELSR